MGKRENKWMGIEEIPSDCWRLQKQFAGDARVVFDVGAHYGRVVGRYLKMFPNAVVYAFEPEEGNFRNMLKRLPKLAGGSKRVKPFRAVVLDYVGIVPFHIASIDVTHSIFKSTQYHPAPIRAVDTPAVRLDSFCSGQGIECIDLLKIDVEGAEVQVLRGASRLLAENRIGLIYAEMQFYPCFEGSCEAWEICAYLNEYGWGLHSLWGKPIPGHRLLGGDAIFMKREKLNKLPKSSR